MKTQMFNRIFLVTSTILLLFVLASCSSTEKVVSGSFLQKRKYTGGYNLNWSKKSSRPVKSLEVKTLSEVPIQESSPVVAYQQIEAEKVLFLVEETKAESKPELFSRVRTEIKKLKQDRQTRAEVLRDHVMPETKLSSNDEADFENKPEKSMNVLAVFGLFFSVAGMLFFPIIGSLLGIVLSSIALSQINKRGEKGAGLARTGITIGVVGLLLALLVVVIVMSSGIFSGGIGFGC